MATTDMIARAIAMSKASLVDGKVPASELPSYVDDVVEYASVSSFPATGERGKIYVATDTNTSYRWSGTTYIAITGQSDWNQSDTSAPDYIKNKPDITSAKVSQYDKDSAALPEILNAGAKNIFNITKETTTRYGVTFTNNGDGTITSSGTLDAGKDDTYLGLGAVDLPAGDYVFTCADEASFQGYDSYVYVSGSDPIDVIARDVDGYHDFTLTDPTRVVVRIRVRPGYEAATFRPMICTKAMSDVSSAFEPYAPTNRELYENTPKVWQGPRVQYEALVSDDYDFYCVIEAVSGT